LTELMGVALISGAPVGMLIGYDARPLGQSLFFSLLWSAYLLRSKRVANTYEREDAQVGEVFS
jgi:hypothetical protein